MPFSMTVEKQSQGMLLAFEGYMEGEAVAQMSKKVLELRQAGEKLFVFDFSKTTIINSVALGALIDIISATISDSRIKFHFCGLSKSIKSTFTVMGLLNYAREFSAAKEAFAAFSSS